MKVASKKKLLILGATINQLPLVVNAKKRDLFTITVDNIPQNIAHEYSDEFLNISTTEKEKILRVVKTEKIAGIVTCASDVAMPTLSYLGEKLKLSTVSQRAVATTIYKDLFRVFQKKHGIPTPLH